MSPHAALPTPSREEIELLPAFDRLGVDRITLVTTGRAAADAAVALAATSVWGFDTESRPTFRPGEQSEGPHILQLATTDHAWVFQLHDPGCRDVAAELLARPGVMKAGFGLGDDKKHILRKLGVVPRGVLDLNTVFRHRGYRKDMGVKGAIAVLFGQRFAKSKKAGTSNWSHAVLTEAQLLYAANDAWAAARVVEALGLDVAGWLGTTQD